VEAASKAGKPSVAVFQPDVVAQLSDSLVFDDAFECGNLKSAERVFGRLCEHRCALPECTRVSRRRSAVFFACTVLVTAVAARMLVVVRLWTVSDDWAPWHWCAQERRRAACRVQARGLAGCGPGV
jgi:hypothetical protein